MVGVSVSAVALDGGVGCTDTASLPPSADAAPVPPMIPDHSRRNPAGAACVRSVDAAAGIAVSTADMKMRSDKTTGVQTREPKPESSCCCCIRLWLSSAPNSANRMPPPVKPTAISLWLHQCTHVANPALLVALLPLSSVPRSLHEW